MDCHYPVSGSIHPILLFIQSHIVAQHVCDIQPGDSSVDKKVVHGNVSHRIRLLILIKFQLNSHENQQRSLKTNTAVQIYLLQLLHKSYFTSL